LKIAGLSLDDIKGKTQKTECGYLLYLGEQVEITTISNTDRNRLISGTMYQERVEDKYMVKYRPYNQVLFDNEYVDKCVSQGKIISASLFVDNKNCRLCVGVYEKYTTKYGVLICSGQLSLNGLIEQQTTILSYRNNSENVTMEKVRVLTLGMTPNGPIGFWYMPKEKGLAYNVGELQEHLGVSASNNAVIDCNGWFRYELLDWVKDCSLRQVA
jgi:hypothetical protein